MTTGTIQKLDKALEWERTYTCPVPKLVALLSEQKFRSLKAVRFLASGMLAPRPKLYAANFQSSGLSCNNALTCEGETVYIKTLLSVFTLFHLLFDSVFN